MKKYLVAFVLCCTALTGCADKEGASSSATVTEQPQKVYRWKLVSTYPKNFPGLGAAAENLTKLIDEASNGRLKIKVYGAGQLVPAFEVFDTVSQGTAEMGQGAAYYWKGKASWTPLFTTIPFGLNAQEMNAWLHYGGGLELWRELYEPFNLIPFPGGNTGIQMAGWFNREINSLEDLKGLKMRIPGLGGEVISKLGVEAVNIPGGDIYTSLQTGVIDATEWVGPYNDLAFGFHQIAKYYYYPGWHEPGPTIEFIVNKQAYESLPEDLQKIVKAATGAINQDMLDDYTAHNNAALETLINEHGVDLRPLPKEVLVALKLATDEVMAENSAADPDFKRVYESLKAFQAQSESYHKISEQAYYNIRSGD